MGINAEMVTITAGLRSAGKLTGRSVVEIGAQDVCVVKDVSRAIIVQHGFTESRTELDKAADLYAALGFDDYSCIDASGEYGALVFDLNNDIGKTYGFRRTFDLVTNLGTAEHCFDQRTVFKNLHDLCNVGGVMIHALPAQGNVNHAFFNYHPRFFVDLAAANGYEIVLLAFTVDYKPVLHTYSKEEFRKWDSHDILFYCALRKLQDREFTLPFDGMFSAINRIEGYHDTGVNPLSTEFAPYFMGGNWEYTKVIVTEQQPDQPRRGWLSRILKVAGGR